MLKIKDATGKVVGVLKDEDNEPIICQCKCCQEKGKCVCNGNCKCNLEEGDLEDGNSTDVNV